MSFVATENKSRSLASSFLKFFFYQGFFFLIYTKQHLSAILTQPFFFPDFDPSLLSCMDVCDAAEHAEDRLDTDSTDVPRTSLPPVHK